MTHKMILLFILFFVIGLTDAALMEKVNPGNVEVELDGYKMSFSLPESVPSYDIETLPTSNDNLKFNRYEVYINEAGEDDALLTILFYIWQEPQFFPVYEEMSRNDLEGIGTMITMPLEIGGTKGHAAYNYPEGDPAVDPLKSWSAGFRYYPNALPDGKDLKGIYEVQVDTMGAADKDSRVMPIFQKVLETIHLS